jgi:hypothetical protein
MSLVRHCQWRDTPSMLPRRTPIRIPNALSFGERRGANVLAGVWDGPEEHPDKGGTWTFLAGTGKWKDITGGGTFKFVSGGQPQADHTAQFCFEHSGKYTLP